MHWALKLLLSKAIHEIKIHTSCIVPGVCSHEFGVGKCLGQQNVNIELHIKCVHHRNKEKERISAIFASNQIRPSDRKVKP